MMDWNDQVRQMEAITTHDITNTTHTTLEAAAKTIKAKMLIVVVKQDHTVNPLPSIKFASLVNAQLIEIDSKAGHTTTEIPFAAMRDFLNK